MGSAQTHSLYFSATRLSDLAVLQPLWFQHDARILRVREGISLNDVRHCLDLRSLGYAPGLRGDERGAI
jgi:hypothetical protein